MKLLFAGEDDRSQTGEGFGKSLLSDLLGLQKVEDLKRHQEGSS